jgi:hypothetical protein
MEAWKSIVGEGHGVGRLKLIDSPDEKPSRDRGIVVSDPSEAVRWGKSAELFNFRNHTHHALERTRCFCTRHCHADQDSAVCPS